MRTAVFGDNSRRAVVGRAEKSYTFQYGHHVVQLFEHDVAEPTGRALPKDLRDARVVLALKNSQCVSTACMSPRTAARPGEEQIGRLRKGLGRAHGRHDDGDPGAAAMLELHDVHHPRHGFAAEATEVPPNLCTSHAMLLCLSLSLFFCVRCDATFYPGTLCTRVPETMIPVTVYLVFIYLYVMMM